MKTVTAEFNILGYTVYVYSPDGTIFDDYSAGNCQFDSAQSLPAHSSGTLDIATIEAYAESTAKDMALEHNARYLGITRQDDPYGNE